MIDAGAPLCIMARVSFTNPLIAAGVCGLASLFTDRVLTPVEACEAYLSRIAGLDGALGAYNHVDAEGARAAAHASAERWRRGAARSLLDGVPLAIKANVAVAGWPWHAGVGAYRERRAEADAPIVARLREAGAVLLGLTNMHEGAYGAVTDNPHFGRTHNPWNFDLTAGGSSGGSGAAAAAGLCAAAIGTDTLGSVRIPSSFCGLWGHKPTPGLAPTGGITPMGWALDTAGVHARSAADAGRVFGVLCTDDAELAADLAQPAPPEALADAFSQAPLGVLEVEGVELAPSAREGVERAVERARAAGLLVESVRLPGLDLPEVRRTAMFVCAVESAVEHAEALARAPEGFSDTYRERLGTAERRSAIDLARAYQDLQRASERIRDGLSAYGAVLLPTTPVAPFPFARPQPQSTGELTTLASVAGLPATAFPVGLDDEGLPRSVQAVGWDDETTLGLSALLAADPGAPPAYRG